ncbi:MAG: DUF1902 domain-containing protein [Gammaproteobacteria bacterium]|nr:DUF1902 domain-containing protein [Gammaproteobacteria bacterium]MCY4276544.1 DUF1902 domain-containing protein [Gammaproteobacteria bacterium]
MCDGIDDMEHIYFAEISWDDEAGVWYILDTDVPGLVAEAASHQDMACKVLELVPDLYELNRHLFRPLATDVIPLRMMSSRLETIRLAG